MKEDLMNAAVNDFDSDTGFWNWDRADVNEVVGYFVLQKKELEKEIGRLKDGYVWITSHSEFDMESPTMAYDMRDHGNRILAGRRGFVG